MNDEKQRNKFTCQVCGGSTTYSSTILTYMECKFCGFKKTVNGGDHKNEKLTTAADINAYFQKLYNSMEHKETRELIVSVSRFYKESAPEPEQVNFFKSKNIMFLLEQHGFHMVSRKSRFSSELSLVIRKV